MSSVLRQGNVFKVTAAVKQLFVDDIITFCVGSKQRRQFCSFERIASAERCRSDGGNATFFEHDLFQIEAVCESTLADNLHVGRNNHFFDVFLSFKRICEYFDYALGYFELFKHNGFAVVA